MNYKYSLFLTTLLTSMAASGLATAQTVDAIVVTGSRVVMTGNQAPTPVTVLPTEELIKTTPANISQALNRLPQFAGEGAQRGFGGGTTNPSGSYLNLRRFGTNRNLVMLDGTRLPPTATTGAVDTNTIPQGLISRVDVVTAGASAVYGSDAVTGVINFIIDKNFNGLKANAQAGISKYGDNESSKFSVVAGTPIFGGRGHLEGSFDYYYSAGIDCVCDRPGGDEQIAQIGAGTAADPFRIIKNGRIILGTPGSIIVPRAGTPFPAVLRDIAFKSDGVASTFVHGNPASQIEQGGDGTYWSVTTMYPPVRTNQAFARFDYDLTDTTSAYIQGSYSTSTSEYNWIDEYWLNLNIRSGNPFIPASLQQTLTANNIPSFDISRVNHKRYGYTPLRPKSTSKNSYVMTGLEGKFLDKFSWNFNYVYDEAVENSINYGNPNSAKTAAALDAVVNPANGRIVCQVSLTSFASRYAGCEPLNLFGPTAPTQSAFDWATDDTEYTLTNTMNDVNFAIAGSPFSLWAGPVNFSINGEYRTLSLRNVSNADPTAAPDCTGLRDLSNCTGKPQYTANTTGSMYAKQNVKEVGGEVLIPLLRDLPFAKSFDLNLAGRRTDYSTSGVVYTWKIGGSWELTDELRLRAAQSRDIRAPTLFDLFRPTGRSVINFTDLHTGTSAPIDAYNQGNKNLVPEVGETKTIGFVYQPRFIPRLAVAIDYYQIDMRNAITAAGTGTNFQRECETSNGTSPYCAALPRPLPFSDRSLANFPTAAITSLVNAARQYTRGVDAEINYRFDLADVWSTMPGSVRLRTLVAYQPTLTTQAISSIAATQAAGISGNSKTRVNTALSYTVGGLSAAVTNRWQSKQHPSDPSINVDLRGKIPAYSYTDLALNYKFNVRGHEIEPYMTIENLFNKKPPITGQNAGTVGISYPSPPGFDVIGRYFSVGVRTRL